MIEDPAETERRRQALAAYRILDTPAEQGFDDIVLLAATLCATPAALVSLVDADRQWFKARAGFEACETPIGQSVCAHALRQPAPLIVPDLTADPRTHDNPLVAGPPHLRFYAGVPLITPEGVPIGTVCALDNQPRPAGLTPAQLHALQALARQAMHMLEARRVVADRDRLLAEQQRRLEDERRALREADLRARFATEAGRIGTFELDVPTGEMVVSAEMCRLFGLPVARTHPISRFEHQVIEDDRHIASDQARREDGSAPLEVRYRIRRADDGRVRWLERRSRFRLASDGRTAQMFGTVQDVTDQQLAVTRVAALVELGDALREAESVEQMIGIAAQLIGRTLSGSRAGYAVIDPREQMFVVDQDWTSVGVQSLMGRHSTDLFPATLERLQRGETVAVADIPAAAWLTPDHAFYDNAGVRAMIRVPVLVHGELVAVLFVHEHQPRQWSEDELDFVRSVADRTYAAVAKGRAEQEQTMLNQELGHRLKNTMAMVQAIASQTLRAAGDREAVRSFERRLHALGTAHDVLLQRSWTAADIRAVIGSALRAVGQEDRFSVTGPSVELGARAALSMSLLIHELATNAVKHGALSNEQGRVAVNWAIEERDEGATLVLVWTERGGPPAVNTGTPGLGSKLIRAGLVGAGGVDTRYTPQGFEATLSATLARLQRV